jgi:aminopeptidase YwaD
MKRVISIFVVFLLVQTVIVYSQTDSSARLRDHVRILTSDSLQGRGLGTEGTELARDYIIHQFMDAGITPLFDYFQQPFRFRSGVAWIPAVNIAGYIEGSDPDLKNEYIVIGAHLDHLGYTLSDNGEKTIYPGADDNASGVAAIIEIARYFSENPSLLGRSLIIVAFDAEESGLWGSRHFVANSPVPIESIRLMFSLDMVGMYEANNGVHLRGMGSLAGGADEASRVADVAGIRLRNTGSNIARRTDTAPFGDKGIPAVHVFTGTNSPYHKPEDRYDLLDYEGMGKITRYLKDLLSAFSFTDTLDPDDSFSTGEIAETGLKDRFMMVGIVVNTGSGFHRYDGAYYRGNPVLGFNTGMYFQIPINRFFTIQQEVLYDFNGSEAENGKIRRHSLTLPLNLQLGTPRGVSGPLRIFVFGGGWYRHNFGGSSGKTTLDFDGEYNKNEWGYSAGIGLDIFRFTIGFTGRRGISSIMQEDFQDSRGVFDTNRFFTLGYRFK